MNAKIQKLILALKDSFEGTPWLGDAVITVLKRVNYQCVNNTFGNSNNSIAIIVQHMINWRIFVIEKLEGNQAYDIKMNSSQDWTIITVKSEAEWNTLIDELILTQQKIITILEQQSDDTFLARMTSGKDYNFEYLIEGIVQHDIYHTGQVGLLQAISK